MSWNKKLIVLCIFVTLVFVGWSQPLPQPDVEVIVIEPEVVEPEVAEPELVIQPATILTDEQLQEIHCLAQNIYFEARSESRMGQFAVAMVTLNRVKSKRFPNTICRVIKQAKTYGNGHPIRNKCHFSWYCDGKSDRPYNKEKWKEIYQYAFDIYVDQDMLIDITQGADHYFATYIEKPEWSRGMTHIAVIGTHTFYRRKT